MKSPVARSLQLAGALISRWQDRSSLSPAHWLQRTANSCAESLRLEVVVSGQIPARGLIVANHLGYLDVIALASVLPCRFVAKANIANWPVFGAFATRGGSIYVDRSSRVAVAAASAAIARSLGQPLCTVIFPEATSSGGTDVLAFHSSLLEPAIAAQSLVTPLGISYYLENGNPASDMAYHGEMTLLPHLWRLLALEGMKVRLTFGRARILESSRKVAAIDLRAEVEGLASAIPALDYVAG